MKMINFLKQFYATIEKFKKQKLLTSWTEKKDYCRRNQNTSVPILTKNTQAWYYREASSKLSGTPHEQNFKVYWPLFQSQANELPSCRKGTSDFIKKLSKIENINRATLDVRWFYTNILNSEEIEARKEALNSVNQKPIASEIIIRLLLLILTLNNFIFNVFHYLPNMWCAMGTIYVPSCASVFMGNFDRNLFPYTRSIVKIYCWFIGDLFLLCNGSKKGLLDFFLWLNPEAVARRSS